MSSESEKSPGVELVIPKTQPVHRLMWDHELDELPPLKWLIQGVLPAGSLGVVYGDPGAGKTFLVLDWAFSIATGHSWWGHQVEKGEVVYIVGEGWAGIRDRAASWKASRHLTNFDKTGIAFHGRAIRLLDPHDVEQFVKSVEFMETAPKLIVIDTLARNAVGLEENSARDMGQVVSCCDILREAFGCAVLLLHHATKSQEHGPSLRGSGALKAAVDSVVMVSMDRDGLITVSCEKQKDAPRFKKKFFKFVPIGKSVTLQPALPEKPKKGKEPETRPEDEFPEPMLHLT